MANLNASNTKSVYDILLEHNFIIKSNLREDFKCIICHNILINPYRSSCGCNFCQKCFDEYEISGAQFCPGNTDECATADLSDVLPDPKVNREISQLIVKCPEEMCNYENQLKDIDEHWRICPKKSVKCPFSDVGCGRGTVSVDELGDHLQGESYNHSKILVDLIDNLRNEMAELRQNAVRNDAIIDSLNEEIRSMKLENAALQREVDGLRVALDDRVGAIGVEVDTRFGEMRRELTNAVESGTVSRLEMAARMDAMSNCLDEKVDANFVRKVIDEMEQSRKHNAMSRKHLTRTNRLKSSELRIAESDDSRNDNTTRESNNSRKGNKLKESAWTCVKCTFLNIYDDQVCSVCGHVRKETALGELLGFEHLPSINKSVWICKQCYHMNDTGSRFCANVHCNAQLNSP